MSYCRFSSDNWRSDVYAFEHVDAGFVVHVAGRRLVGECPEVDFALLYNRVPTPDAAIADFTAQHDRQMKWLETAERVAIGLPEDGATFCLPTLGDLLAKLIELRALGYHVPQSAIDDIVADLASESAPEEVPRG